MKLLRAVLTGCLLTLPAFALAQDVKIDYDKAFNFAPVKTYSIRIGTAWGNDLSQRRVLEVLQRSAGQSGVGKLLEQLVGARLELQVTFEHQVGEPAAVQVCLQLTCAPEAEADSRQRYRQQEKAGDDEFQAVGHGRRSSPGPTVVGDQVDEGRGRPPAADFFPIPG